MKKQPVYEQCDLAHNGHCVSEPCICKGLHMSQKRKLSDFFHEVAKIKYSTPYITPEGIDLTQAHIDGFVAGCEVIWNAQIQGKLHIKNKIDDGGNTNLLS